MIIVENDDGFVAADGEYLVDDAELTSQIYMYLQTYEHHCYCKTAQAVRAIGMLVA